MTAGPFARSRSTTAAAFCDTVPVHPEDSYGGLSEVSFYDSGDEWSAFEITEAEFERVWNSNGE
jgi:hypothetical protein